MKLSDYKALVKSHPRIAMFLDLTERYPRGPKGNLRPHHYASSGKYWSDRHETQLNEEALRADKKTSEVIEDSSVKKHGFCSVAYGYDPLALQRFFKKFGCTEHWDVVRTIQKLDPAGECPELSIMTGWDKQATRTRRGKRMNIRINQLQKWVKSNVTTAYYSFRTRYGRVHVHADSETSAQTQYDMFLKSGIAAMETEGRTDERYQHDGAYYCQYLSPAIEGPAALMGLNEDFIKSNKENIQRAKDQILAAQAKITAMEVGMEMVQSYAINMTASYDYEVE
jgi:hypothetical protein